MESSETTTTTSSPPLIVISSSPTPPTSPPLPAAAAAAAAAATSVLSPCAACKILRRRCAAKCMLAPYFPPNEPLKFTTAHRVFGASNIIKLLQELPEIRRADAVSSMVYEANARIRDPVYGCAGAVCQLQHQVGELQAQLAKAHAELAGARAQNDSLVAAICAAQELAALPAGHQLPRSSDQELLLPAAALLQNGYDDACHYLEYDDTNCQGAICWEPLWTS